ncbi:MAG: PP2C family protein-serine/threonine phosphatase [Bacteroidia bacterium]
MLEYSHKDPEQRQKDQLYALLQVTRAINNNASARDLFSIYEFILHKQLGFSRIAYCSFDEIWKWPVHVDADFDIARIKPERDLEGFDDLTILEPVREADMLEAFDVVIPVKHKGKALAYLLLGRLDRKGIKTQHKADLEFVQTISNIISVAIENKRLFKENVQQEMLKRELEMAKEVQSMFIPSSLPQDEHFDFAAVYKPVRQIGGDYYDFIRLSEREVMFCMADVSGKGVAAALLMANFQAFLRARISVNTDLQSLVSELNDHVVQAAKGEKFITLFIARYTIDNQMLEYVNAGHNPPVLCSGNEILVLTSGTTGLGMLEKLHRLESGLIRIDHGSLLVCYTDGLVEQENEGGVDFGIEQLQELVRENKDLSAAAFNEMLIRDFTSHKGDQPSLDDVSLLTCRFY